MLKNQILTELLQNRSQPLSGQMLANRYQVSRNAIWKTINALKAEGYPIDAISKEGYLLSPDCDLLSTQVLQKSLQNFPDLQIAVFSTIDSTNSEARRMLASGFDGYALIVSDTQTNGRGRKGKSFYSPQKTGIYMSLILPIPYPCQNPTLLTIAAAVAVLRSVSTLTGIQLQIKWVNDIFFHGKKAGGILTEAISDLESGQISHAVVGIGLNLHSCSFPDSLSSIATSLSFTEVHRCDLIAEICTQLLTIDWQNSSTYINEYTEHSLVLHQTICYQGKLVQALSIESDGGLTILHADGHTETLHGGTIELT